MSLVVSQQVRGEDLLPTVPRLSGIFKAVNNSGGTPPPQGSAEVVPVVGIKGLDYVFVFTQLFYGIIY